MRIQLYLKEKYENNVNYYKPLFKNNPDFSLIALTYFNYIFFDNNCKGDIIKKLTIQEGIDENDENCMRILEILHKKYPNAYEPKKYCSL